MDDQITQTPHRSTPYPSPMSIWRHIGGHMHLLQNFAPPASSLPSTLPQITQPGCEASSLSPVLGKHRTLHPSLTGFQLSLERYSSAIIASWTPPLRLPPCPAPSFPLQMHPPPVPRCNADLQISKKILRNQCEKVTQQTWPDWRSRWRNWRKGVRGPQ